METWAILLGLGAIAATILAAFIGRHKLGNLFVMNSTANTYPSTKTIEAPRTTLVNASTYVHAPVTLTSTMPSPKIAGPTAQAAHDEEDTGLGDSTITIDEVIEVEPGALERLAFEADAGDVVEGLIDADGLIDVYLVPRRRYPAFKDGNREGVITCAENESTIHVRRKLRSAGPWYLILDAYNRRNPRTVHVDVTVGP